VSSSPDAPRIEAMKDDPDAWGAPVPNPSPRRSERRQRGTVVSVRLTAEELAEVQSYAELRGLSLSGALRAAALDAKEAAGRVVTCRVPASQVEFWRRSNPHLHVVAQ
jgi:hypothetical protein